jgi:deoxyribodipyrimidine photo-lyase
MKSLSVVLIRNDRRLHDHKGLRQAASAERFLILATYPPQWNFPDRMSSKRKEATLRSINAFAESLGSVPLHFTETPEIVLRKLAEDFEVTVLAEAQGATEEERQLSKLGFVSIQRTKMNRLYDSAKLYPTFTPFRSYAETKLSVDAPEDLPRFDLNRSHVIPEYLFRPFPLKPHPSSGEKNGLSRLAHYLKTGLSTYAETRNYLEDPEGSSKLSYFFANGELSVRDVYQKVEAVDPKNWLLVELLWREFFWQHGTKFPLPDKGKRIPEWEKKLEHPLARAIYHELVETGFISNRSRQILASYLIYELDLDWKTGASFYEEHLLDYDVHVNWGNWLYITGLKYDPRGGRKFNLDLQAEKFDPSGAYVKKWGS